MPLQSRDPGRRVPAPVRQFATVLLSAGRQCYLVGGALRDLLVGRPSADFDIATDARPEEVQRLYRRTVPTGIKHGTVTVLADGTTFEVTTFRTETTYSDGRRPDAVRYATTILEDLGRRDFTINALALDLGPGGELVDPFGGRADLKAGVVRAVGDAAQRFAEDGLRLLRACRFVAQLGYTLEDTTRVGMVQTADNLRRIAVERVRDELDKMLLSANPANGLHLMAETGLLVLVLPELEEGRGVQQRSRNRQLHCFDVFTHCVATSPWHHRGAQVPCQPRRRA